MIANLGGGYGYFLESHNIILILQAIGHPHKHNKQFNNVLVCFNLKYNKPSIISYLPFLKSLIVITTLYIKEWSQE